MKTRSAKQLTQYPYAVIGEHHYRDGTKVSWTLTRRHDLADAIAYARKLTYAWLRLLGGQASPLVWYVLDERTGMTHRRLAMSTEEDHNGEQTKQDGKLF